MNIEPRLGADLLRSAAIADDDDELAGARKRKIIIGATVLILVALLAFLAWRGSEKPAAPTEQPPRITVVRPGTQKVAAMISATGTLAARREMPIGVAGEGGMINRVYVEAGDWVRAGQTLATIDASVQTQQAAQLRAQIAAARADAAIAQSELTRSQALVSRGFVSKADLERKQATRDAAQARVAVAQAQLGETNAQIGRLAIRAPAAGLVLTRDVEPGQVVMPSNGALFRMAKGGEMELRATLAESDLAQIAVGDSAQVRPVGSSRSFAGHVWQIAPVINAQSRQGQVRIALDYDKALRPGGFATADLHTGVRVAPVLPESAVLSDEKGNFVYVVGADRRVARRDVKVGPVTAAGLPIFSGLVGTEKVVLSAGAFLSVGDLVSPVLDERGQ